MPERQWTEQQLAAITEREREVAVGAAAGSGKTAVLIERVVRAALGMGRDGPVDPVPLDRMLIVTFTRAAAAELRSRLHAELAAELTRRRQQGADSTAIRQQLALLPAARISTIHSFCSSVIRSYGHERGSTLRRLLNEDETKLVRHELAGELLDRLLARDDDYGSEMRELALAWGGSEGVGSEDISGGEFGSSLRRTVLRLADFLRSLEDPQRWWDELCSPAVLAPGSFDFSHPLVQALEASLQAWVADVASRDAQTASRLMEPYPDAGMLELIRRRTDLLRGLSLSAGWEACHARLLQLRVKQDDIKWKPDLIGNHARDIDKEDEFTKAWIRARNEPVARSAKDWIDYLSQPWEEVASRENACRGLLATLHRATLDLLAEFDGYKRSRALMDFSDLEQSAFEILAQRDDDGKLLRDSGGELVPSESAQDLRSQLRMVMVDEYQDTNPLQDAILRLVTPAPVGTGRPSFIVGDVKQSIYAFRLATPGLFSERLHELAGEDRDDGRAIVLNRNFRSRRAVVNAVNTVFSGLLTDEFGGQDYSANELVFGARYEDEGSPGTLGEECRPRLHLVYADDNDEDDGDGGMSTDRLVYRRVARVLRGIHAAGQMVVDPDSGEARRVQWRDMVVLMRTTSGRSETLLSELEQEGVPAYAPGRSGFYERPEVSDALSLLRVIDNPLADIPLAAVLSGPVVGLDVNQLATVAQHGTDSVQRPLWDRLQLFLGDPPEGSDEGLLRRLREFMERLGQWRNVARSMPLGQLLWKLYNEAGLLASAASLERGQQRVANLSVLHEMARSFEQNERQGLARFLHFLEHSRRSAGDLGEAPLLSEAQDVVRVMTVHQAKGLEFPVVVVPDLHRRFNAQDIGNDVVWERNAGIGGRFVRLRGADPLRSETLGRRIAGQALRRQMVAEELRILYVALTRARERLELVAAVKEGFGGGISDSHPAADANCWLDWVAAQLAGAINPEQFSGARSWEVLTAAPHYEDDEAEQVEQPLDREELEQAVRRVEWKYPHAVLATLPRKLAVTELGRLANEPEEADASEMLAAVEPRGEKPAPDPAAREQAMRFGTAMHLLLAHIDLQQPLTEQGLEELVQALLAEGLLDDGMAGKLDRMALLDCAATIADSGLLEGSEIHRELPVSMSLPLAESGLLPEGISAETHSLAGEMVLQGTLDLLAVGTDSLLVLDWKTDRTDARGLLARHSEQLQWYCRMAHAMLPQLKVRWALYGLSGAGLVGPFDWKQ